LSNILSLNICWRLGDEQPLSVCELLLLSLNIDWRFWRPLIAKTETIEFSSSSTGLEGVNNVFSHVSLILVAIFGIFAKLLLTSF
jgi:hypothetical protein